MNRFKYFKQFAHYTVEQHLNRDLYNKGRVRLIVYGNASIDYGVISVETTTIRVICRQICSCECSNLEYPYIDTSKDGTNLYMHVNRENKGKCL